MRKIIALFVLVMTLAALALPIYATDSATMSVSAGSSSVSRGETVEFTVRMTAVEDCRSAGIILNYDSSVFEFVSGNCTVAGVSMSSFSNGTGNFAFSSGTSVSGTVFTFRLRVKDNAPFGSYTVGGSGNARDSAGSIATSVSGTKITVACKHNYTEWTRIDENKHSKTCSGCGDVIIESHDWASSTIDQYASCVADGQRTVKCTACGESKTEVIPKNNYHAIQSYTKVDDNSHKGSCIVCGQTFTVSHSWDDGVVMTPATCAAGGQTLYTCTGTNCGATKTVATDPTGEHTYEFECGTECVVCGDVRENGHTYGTEWKTDKQNHFHVCIYCGAEGAAIAHTPGAAATAWLPQTCTVCKYIIQPAGNHKHNPSDEWTMDKNAHWYSCPGCSEQLERTQHDFDNACDNLCEVCGYTRNTSHSFSTEYESDAASHYLTCTICGTHKDVASHIPGPPATELEPQTCMVCSYVLAPAVGHQFVSFWSWNENGHFHRCDCGEADQVIPHTWGPGVEGPGVLTYVCTVCGAQRSRLAPLDWRFIAILAVPFVLGCALGTTVTLLTRRRRR